MGSYYNKLRAQKDEYDKDYYDHSSDKRKKYDYPTINVKQIVNCCDHKKDESTRCGCNSAFRAVGNTIQPIPATASIDFQKVRYPVEQFDVNNEYNPVTSTFTPQQNGIYLIIASILVSTAAAETRLELQIRVNGQSAVRDFETFRGDLGSITVTTSLQLQAGDTVEIFVRGIPAPFNILGNPDFTHFEASRIG